MMVIRNAHLRKILGWTLPLLLIPLAVLLGATAFADKGSAYITLLVTVLSLLLFMAGFEKKRTGTRRMILAAVMVALSCAGRLMPIFKPVTALTVLAAMYLGREAGFLTGALSALISNFYFGQGPWTPFQMLSWGLIGFAAGLLSEPLKKHRWALLLYGVAAGIAYSFIMDIWTVLWYNGTFSWGLYAAALGTAVPYTIVYAVSNVVFLALFARPFGRKLERIRIKYGI